MGRDNEYRRLSLITVIIDNWTAGKIVSYVYLITVGLQFHSQRRKLDCRQNNVIRVPNYCRPTVEFISKFIYSKFKQNKFIQHLFFYLLSFMISDDFR